MFKHITIKNFAILDELTLDLFPGLTVITGETGSGKSLILEALHIVTGGRGEKTHVRDGAARAVIEATNASEEFRRIIASTGNVKSFVNDEPCSVANYQDRLAGLIDFHGQHEQQLILKVATHIQYLDRYAGIESVAAGLKEDYNELTRQRLRLRQLTKSREESFEKRELQEFQLREITAAAPQLEEDAELENQARVLRHYDEIIQTAQRLHHEIVSMDHSVIERLLRACRSLEKLQRIDQSFEAFSDELNAAVDAIRESVTGMASYSESLDHDPQRLNEIEERLIVLEELKRKYGGSLDSVLEKQASLENAMDSLGDLDKQINATIKTIRELESRYENRAREAHRNRAEIIPHLCRAMVTEMTSLNMPDSVFEIRIDQQDDPDSFLSFEGRSVTCDETGFDRIEFYLSANPGIAPRPLAKVASGGEISRIMLAMKTVFNENDPVPCLVFDEIDSGISGQTAARVADNLVKISRSRQVLCITHLPQIAIRADHHLHVVKNQDQENTTVAATYLDESRKRAVIKELTDIT